MNNQQNKSYESIKGIIKICNDGAKGYEKVAKSAESMGMQTLFSKISQDRKSYVAVLERELKLIYGEEVSDENTVLGNMHRNWMELKATISSNTDKVLLEECIRGENAALDVYEEAKKDNSLPSSVLDIVNEQWNGIESAKSKMEVLLQATNSEKSNVFMPPNQKGEPKEHLG